MSETSSYLKKLRFKPKFKDTWAYSLLTNFRITILIILTVLTAGIFAFVNLPRRINPEVNIPIVFISTVYPGAGPNEVEQQITKPLENAIEQVEQIDQFSSNSQDNISTIVIEFSSRTNTDEATVDIQQAVETVTGLPAEAQEPKVIPLNFEDVPVISFLLTSTADQASLLRFSKQLQTKLEDLPQVQSVVVSGLEKTEVEILINPQVYTAYKISPFQLQEAITSALQTFSVGTVKTDSATMAITVELEQDQLTKLRQLPLLLNQSQIVLGEIAAVSLKSQPNQPPSFFADNSTPATKTVSFSIFKTVSAQLEEAASEAKKLTREEIEKTDNRYQMLIITDFDQEIADQFQNLIKDFSASILLVFLTLLLFLGIKQASIASFVIPLSFFATFAVMYVFNIELSFLSIFSLLLGLGMIVDDAIVMVSAMTDYFKTGKFTPSQTGLLVWNDFIAPTLSSNLTNIWSFLPLLIATGIIGEFTKVISYVVTIALIASTIIALMITIPLMIVVLKPNFPKRVINFALISGFLVITAIITYIFRTNPLIIFITLVWILLAIFSFKFRQSLQKKFFEKYTNFKKFAQKRTGKDFKLQNTKLVKKLIALGWQNKLKTGFISAKKPIALYKNFLKRVLSSKSAKRKIIITVVGLAVFSYLLVPLGLVENEFFPKTDEDSLYVSLELPAGTSLDATSRETLEILDQLKDIDGVEYVLADIGAEVEMTSISQLGETNKTRFSLRLKEDRQETSIQIAQKIRQRLAAYTKGEIQVVEISGGPPTGADVQTTLLGSDLATLQNLAQEVKTYLQNKEGVTNINISTKSGLSKLAFIPDKNKLLEKDISLTQIVGTLRFFTSGLQIDTLSLTEDECQEDCPVQLRVGQELSVNQLSEINLNNSRGELIPILSLGELKLKESPTRITRLNGQRSISISASVLPGFNNISIGQELETFVTTQLNLPEGYTWQTGGTNEENQRSVNSILQAMIIAAILILGTMVVELKSFRQAIIVMLVIPLAVSGVFIVFALTGTPLGFPALIGVLALFGIVVKNSIMIVDKINLNLDIGLEFKEAIADGASSRLEPILFSSATNIIGLLPITLSDPLWRGLGGAIISGLTLSGIIMLFFIPLVYDAWFKHD